MNKTDYHIHSTYSDGSDTPVEIIERAISLGLERIAITDHDTIGGLELAEAAASDKEICFIKGIELSVRYEKTRLIHILGLGIDTKQKQFIQLYEVYRNHRALALSQVLNTLSNRGIHIAEEALIPYALGEKLDRQAVAKWLIANEYAPNMQLAWNLYLDPIPYGENELLEPETAFEMIHAAKGKAYIAHIHKPIGMYGFTQDETLERLRDLQRLGLDGIESRYPSFEDSDIKQIQHIIEVLKLEACGGSDYHGKYRPDVNLGD